MKILILGSDGLIGGFLLNYLKKKKIKVYGTLRSPIKNKTGYYKFYINNKNSIYRIKKIINNCNPDYVINCIAILKRDSNKFSLAKNYLVNCFFPKYLHDYLTNLNKSLILISTDCVFDGKGNGAYSERSIPNAADVYGNTKYLGEIYSKNCLTVRTSIVGLEEKNSRGLLSWFLSKKQKTYVYGFKKAYFNGLTTLEFAKRLLILIKNFNYFCHHEKPIHLISRKISKYHFLKKVNYIFEKKIKIIPRNRPVINRCLKSTICKKPCLSWNKMLIDLKNYYVQK